MANTRVVELCNAIPAERAFALTRLMQGLLYEVRPNDPLTFVAVAAALLLIALAVSFLPARRATKVSPMIALGAR